MDRRNLFLSRESEWRKISDVIRRYGLTSPAILGNIECYRAAAAGNTTPEVIPFADEMVKRDIEAILRTGNGLFESALDIPQIAEGKRQQEAERQLAMFQAESERELNKRRQKSMRRLDADRRLSNSLASNCDRGRQDLDLFGHKLCRDGCGRTVAFSTSERAVNGTLRPLNAEDGSRHTCNSRIGRLEAEFNKSLLDDKGWIEQCEQYLTQVNAHLKDYTLRLVREPKHGQQHLQ